MAAAEKKDPPTADHESRQGSSNAQIEKTGNAPDEWKWIKYFPGGYSPSRLYRFKTPKAQVKFLLFIIIRKLLVLTLLGTCSIGR
jgi:hypothetical protein